MEETFQDKIKKLTFPRLIREMVAAIREEYVKLDVYTFGEVNDGICYGCVATNLECRIAGEVFGITNIEERCERAKCLGVPTEYLSLFEGAINCLRAGYFQFYNGKAIRIDLPIVPEEIYRKLNDGERNFYYSISDKNEEILQRWLKLADDTEALFGLD